MNSCDREVSLLKTLTEDLTRIKFKLLAEDESLLRSYESLVLKNLVSEEEFWNQKEEIREWNKITTMANQSLARTSKNVIKSLYTGGNTNIEGFKLDEIGKMKLLKREEKLMNRYLKEVKENNMNDEEFWKVFEQEQREKNTILVGGINPIFVGDEGKNNKENEMDLDLEVDIMKNTESFDLTAKLFENNGKNEQKKSLIDKFNERNIRVLNEELLSTKVVDKEEIDEEFKEFEIEKTDMILEEKEDFFVGGNKKMVREIERKAYGWEEEAWNSSKNQMNSLKNDSLEYKNLVFNDENKQVRNVFEQMMKSINQRLSKKNINFSHNEEENKSFENEWKSLHQEANKILSFFYLNVKKTQETKDDKLRSKYISNCKEIAGILHQLREKLNKLKGKYTKFGESLLKCLNNLQDRLETALKQLP